MAWSLGSGNAVADVDAPAARAVNDHRFLLWIAAVLSAIGGTVSALGVLDGDKAEIVVPLALALGGLAAAVAMTRFGFFVMLMLALRSSVDVTKLNPGGSAPTDTAWVSSRVMTPSTLVAGLFLLAAVLWLLAQARAGQLRAVDGQGRAWLAFAAAGILSLIGSASRFHSLVAAAQVLSIALMYLVLAQLMTDTRKRHQLLTAVYLSALVPVLYSLAGMAAGHPAGQTKDGFFRISGTFVQTNDFGRYLMLLVLFGFAVHRHVPSRWRRWLTGLLVVCAVLMLLTMTLTAILGTVLGLVVLTFCHSKRALVVLVVAAVCALALAPEIVARVESVTTTSSSYYASDHHANSLLWRFSYWSEVLPLANQDPITGIGLNMTGLTTEQQKQPHNDFLRAYVEEGLVGEITYLALLGSMVVLAVRATRASPQGSLDRDIGAGYLACVVAVIAGSTSDNVFTNVAVMWYLVALGAAASSVDQRRSRRAVPERDPVPASDPGSAGTR